ncbi:MAG: tRNA lysidine(34) synthetase TilS [Chitinophagaceae bacterium]
MNLLNQFISFIHKENLFSPKDKLLLAVSGGIDSVVLCELCHQAGYDFTIAHCNFQLRGAESERDEQFVRSLGNKYNKTVLVKKFDTNAYAVEKKVSIQVAARELRYAWFAELLTDDSRLTTDDSRLTTHHSRLTTLLTAHHADDNIETLLMNFFKGTGIAGLRGILPKQGKVVRPLLFAKKEDIKKFAEASRLNWVEDSSNQSDKYTRNYFRNQLIPLVKNIYPEAENNLANNLQRFREIELLYHQSIDLHKKKLIERKGNEIHIPVLKLQKTVPLASVLYEIIKDYHFSAEQTQEVIALLDSSTGKYVQSSTHRAIKNRNWLIISPNQSTAANNILIEEKDSEVIYEAGVLTFQPNSQLPIPNSPSIACLDAEEIKFPLLLRKWKEGDYFYPLGMRKKKKLARFFIDQKFSKTDKEKMWVLESDKKIIWIVGHRIDDRFKITGSTKKTLLIKMVVN